MHRINDRSCCVNPAAKPKFADITQKVSTQQENWVWQLHTVIHIAAYVTHTLTALKSPLSFINFPVDLHYSLYLPRRSRSCCTTEGSASVLMSPSESSSLCH